MANWTPPTAKGAGWVPSGLAWRRAGEQILKFGDDFSAQMLAIKQWEYEKEQKRIARMQEQAEYYRKQLETQQMQERADIKADYQLQEQRRYDEEREKAKQEFELKKIQIQQQGRTNLAQMRQKQAPSELDEVESDLAITTASAVKDAISKGDVGRLRVLRNNIRFNGQKGRFLQQKATQVRDAEGNFTNTYKVVGANDYRILLKAVDDAIGGSGQGDMYEDIRQRLLKAMEGDDKAIDDEIAKMLDEGINQVLISNIIFQLERE